MFTGKRLAAALILPFHPGTGQHDSVYNHGKRIIIFCLFLAFIVN